jgi:protein TonB
LQNRKDPAAVAGSKSTTAPASASPAPIFDNEFENASSTSNASSATSSSPSAGAAQKSDPETIRVAEMPEIPEPKVTVVAKPLVVKNGNSHVAQSLVQPPPPSLAIPSSSANTALANLASASPVPLLAPHALHISQGVSQGLLVKKVSPVYPTVALQLHKQGPVELIATVSKEGAIKSVKVVSGEPMLAAAAANAVRQWKYRPYLLSGEPVEIETQITVNFRLPD